MFACRGKELLLLGAVVAIIGCGKPEGLDSIQISPTSQSLAVGQTVQFTATGTFGNASHSSTQNVSSSGGNHQCFRSRNRHQRGDNDDHGQRYGV
jgi:hypothetical protein